MYRTISCIRCVVQSYSENVFAVIEERDGELFGVCNKCAKYDRTVKVFPKDEKAENSKDVFLNNSVFGMGKVITSLDELASTPWVYRYNRYLTMTNQRTSYVLWKLNDILKLEIGILKNEILCGKIYHAVKAENKS